MVELPLDTIICGDNVKVLRDWPAECIDLVVTSPPYDNLRTYGGHTWDFPGVAAELTRVLKPGGVIVWVVADATVNGSETLTSMRQAIHFHDVCGLNVHDTMIYEQANWPFPEAVRYNQTWEYTFVFSRGKPKTFNPINDRKASRSGDSTNHTERTKDGQRIHRENARVIHEVGMRTNVWRYFNGRNLSTKDTIAFQHPAIFPEALARDHILSWSNPGDVVLDPFLGSGTTAKMAKLMGRHWLGIEVNPDYVEIARNRLRQEVLQFAE